jgi:hemerythrin-like metal-binding protein
MSLFVFSDEYSVGVPSMDNHHIRLFDIMNKLYDARNEGRAKEMIGPILGELLDYTRYHFTEEERLMEQANYSGIAAQKSAHREFINSLVDYKQQIDDNPAMAVFVVTKVSMTATDWLKSHILRMDKAYESTLKRAGI